VKTVDECIRHPEIGPWLEDMLFEEVVPVLADQVPNALLYAHATLERYSNPFITRPLAGPAQGREAESRVCLAPTLDEYRARFGRSAPRLSEAFGDRVAGKSLSG
jgi:tagaturonate reductase